jgi:hypothetical protein
MAAVPLSSTNEVTTSFKVEPDRILEIPCRSRCLARASSTALASHTVQVTSDAKARPIITAFTTMSACRNMPHGDRSCGSVFVEVTDGPATTGVEDGANAGDASDEEMDGDGTLSCEVAPGCTPCAEADPSAATPPSSGDGWASGTPMPAPAVMASASTTTIRNRVRDNFILHSPK